MKKRIDKSKFKIVSAYLTYEEYKYLSEMSANSELSMSKMVRVLILEKMQKTKMYAPKVKAVLTVQ